MVKTNRMKIASLIVGTALTIAACATPIQSERSLMMKNPIQIAESIERLELYSRPDGMSLSARDQQAVAGFLSGYGRFGDGPLYMNMPTHGTAGVIQTRGLVQNMMAQIGMAGAPIQEGQYPSAPGNPAPVVISYRRLKTLPQDCSIKSDLTRTYNNQPYHEFGCSQNANLAAMVQDHSQFLQPYDLAPPDMRRRMTVYDKYIKGESPASVTPPNQSISATENN